jgi:hypothetical protein
VTIELSRAERRRLQRLCNKIDKLIDTDRRFFERRPDRSHRVRRAFGEEIAAAEIVLGQRCELPPHGVWFVAVKQIRSGARVRAFFIAASDAETDLSEVQAGAIFEAFAAEGTREIEAALRRGSN